MKINNKWFNFSIKDLSLLVMIIITFSFHDLTYLLLFSQIQFILIQYIIYLKENKFHIEKYIWLYLLWGILFVLYGLLSYFWAVDTTDVFSNVLSILQTLLVGSAVIIYLKDYKDYNKLIKVITISGLILCLRLFFVVPKDAWGHDRIGIYIGYGNVAVTYVLSYISMFIFDWSLKNKKIIYSIFSFIMIVFSFLSGSKKSVFIALLGIPLILIQRNNDKTKILKRILLAVSIFLIILILIYKIPIFYDSVGSRIDSMINYLRGGALDKSTYARMTLLELSINTFKENPIFGIGLGAFKYTNFLNYYAHNNYLELLSCLGIVGFILYYWFILKILYVLIKKYKIYFSFFVIIACILFMDLFSVSYILEPVQISIAIIYSCISKNRKEY